MITVCSGFSPSGYTEYGSKFLSSFDRFWDQDINLVVYTEEPVNVPRGECRDLWDCDGSRAFYVRHCSDNRRHGREPVLGWRSKDRAEGYSWRFDAVKFFKQCLIPYDASKTLPQDSILIWLDADVVTFAPISCTFIENLMVDTDLIFLGRGSYHTEIGFWAVRLCEQGRGMLKSFADIFTKDKFLQLSEHHSAFVFDYVRKKAQHSGLRTRNLTPGGGGHVWLKSPLMNYTDHLKGPRRKRMGYSADHPLAWWKNR